VRGEEQSLILYSSRKARKNSEKRRSVSIGESLSKEKKENKKGKKKEHNVIFKPCWGRERVKGSRRRSSIEPGRGEREGKKKEKKFKESLRDDKEEEKEGKRGPKIWKAYIHFHPAKGRVGEKFIL